MTQEEKNTLLNEAAQNIYDETFAEAELLCWKALEIPEGLQNSKDSGHLFELLISLPASLHTAVALRLISESLWRRGMANKALTYSKAALSFAMNLDNKAEQATSLSNVGIVYDHLSDFANALEHFQQAIVIEEELGNRGAVANNLGYIGMVYNSIPDYPRALENMQRTLAFYEEDKDENGIAASLHNIGLVYGNLTDYPRALEFFGKALAMNEESGNNVWTANNLVSIGEIYWRLLDYSHALEYYHKSLAINEKLGVKHSIANSLGNIGAVHLSLSNYPHALEYMQKALAISEELGLKDVEVRNHLNIRETYKRLADYPRALEHYQKSLSMSESLGMKEMVAMSFGNLGDLYSDKKFDGYDAEKAEEYMLKVIAFYEEFGGKKHLPDFYRPLAELFRQENRWEDADRYFRKYHEIYLEIHSEETNKIVQKFNFDRQAAEREKEIALAKAKADAEMSVTTTLLHKVLPSSIASRLIKGEKVADYFTSVSILFADIVGFTPIASKMPARKVLAFLNYVFGEFDRIIEKHGCEKIKTIGDGYMAVAGAPITCEDYAERIARAAIEMMGDIQLPEDIRSSLPKGAIFNIRIGINIGPAFGGIVGENRFVYDIYSDAVNTAARMESHGEPGKIHVSEDFAFHLQNRMDMTNDDLGGITFEERDEIEIKGKGKMKTYFLERL